MELDAKLIDTILGWQKELIELTRKVETLEKIVENQAKVINKKTMNSKIQTDEEESFAEVRSRERYEDKAKRILRLEADARRSNA